MSFPAVPPEVEQRNAEAMVKAVKQAFDTIYPGGVAAIRGEVTGLKSEVNAAITAINLVKAEYTAFKFEPPPFFDLWAKLEERKLRSLGQLPEQLKTLGTDAKNAATKAQQRADAAHRLAQSANQNAGTALRRANQIGAGVQQGITARLTPLTQSISTLRTQLGQRVTAVGRDAIAALQGVRRVGTDLNTKSNQLTRRITVLERRQTSGGAGGQDAAALRREGDRTRQAVRDLTNAMRGAGPGSQQFRRQLDAIEQSLR